MTAAGEVLQLPLADIRVGERIGFFNAAVAEALGCTIRAEGQHTPILVRRNGPASAKPWTLIDGLHRLRGCELVKLPTILAIAAADKSSDQAALQAIEASANLNRRGLRPIERSMFVGLVADQARARISTIPGPDPLIGMYRNVGFTPNAPADAQPVSAINLEERQALSASAELCSKVGWSDAAAEQLGFSVRSLFNHLQLRRAIVQELHDLAEQLNAHPLGERMSNMLRLASIDVSARRAVAEAIVNDPEMVSIDAAKTLADVSGSKGARGTPAQQLAGSLRRRWGGLDLADKREFMRELVDLLTPGMKDELLKRLSGDTALEDGE